MPHRLEHPRLVHTHTSKTPCQQQVSPNNHKKWPNSGRPAPLIDRLRATDRARTGVLRSAQHPPGPASFGRTRPPLNPGRFKRIPRSTVRCLFGGGGVRLLIGSLLWRAPWLPAECRSLACSPTLRGRTRRRLARESLGRRLQGCRPPRKQ